MITRFPCLKLEGGLIAADLVDQIADGNAPGQKAADFGLENRHLMDEIAAAWTDARAFWTAFQHRLSRLPASDPATTPTRDQWVIPLLSTLGYEPTYNPRAAEVDGMTFAISHRAGADEATPPVHVVGCRQSLDRRAESGRPRLAPHSLVQEYLNRTEHVWALVTNGFTLRVLRDSQLIRRQSYIEFDLQQMMESEKFADFALLYRVIHRTRLPRAMDDADQCLLERYHDLTKEQGGRVRERLRDGVEDALKLLANALLKHPKNNELTEKAHRREFTPLDFYQQLLRLIYRVLFLMVAEERNLISKGRTYRDYYSIGRLRRLAENRAAYTEHPDLWLGLQTVFRVFQDESLATHLEVSPLNGDLFDQSHTALLSSVVLSNRDLLMALWRLSMYRERDRAPLRRINYGALDVEELGSVYESLLDYQPVIVEQHGSLTFDLVSGTERKTTGSYYTPPELVNELIESALVPVIDERLSTAKTTEEKERALLDIKVCDPACGSGHFLLAAARRLAKELARVRTGETEPTPEEQSNAMRRVIAHSIYGVDRNPLAVDLCKVALWIEGTAQSKPLTFIDHRIRCGDSLVGVLDLSVLREGIPDEAFDPVAGDDKPIARAVKKRNRDEQRGVRMLAFEPAQELHELTDSQRQFLDLSDDDVKQVRRKAAFFEGSRGQATRWWEANMACNLWTAAFFVELTEENERAGRIPSTEPLRSYLDNPKGADARMVSAAMPQAERLRFFNWPMEFPEVFAQAGFDVVLVNPPWERIKLQEQEFFAVRNPEIAHATNKSARKKLIDALRDTNPVLVQEFGKAKHEAEAQSKFVRQSGRFPFSAVGDVNTYALFAELARDLISPNGYAGLIIPTGIATDDTLKGFFSDLMVKHALVQLTGFENEEFIFPAIANVVRFCAFVVTREGNQHLSPKFAFYIRRFEQLCQYERFFEVSRTDLELLNPNTLTCPVFRTRADAALTRKIYQSVPILENELRGENPWGVHFIRMFDMSNDSELFSEVPRDGYLPLYEAKMFWHFDHRFASYELKGLIAGKGGRGLPDMPLENHENPDYVIQPQYWIAKSEVEQRKPSYWRREWFIAFRDITSAKLERTAVFSVLPKVGVGNSAPILLPKTCEARVVSTLLANLNSLVFDYVTRQKIAGTHMNFFFVKQLPVLPPSAYTPADFDLISPRVLELVYTSWDMKPFAEDCGYRSGPFRWDNHRRALLRAELDAYYAKLYGLTRDELRYILDPKEVHGEDFPGETFRVLKEKELRKYGEYRTRRLVLEAWDRLFKG